MDDSQKRNTSTSLEKSTKLSIIAELVDIADRLLTLVYKQEELIEQSDILTREEKIEMYNSISEIDSRIRIYD